MSPGGSGYFTCIQNMKLVTNKFKSGGLSEKDVVATWNVGNHLSIYIYIFYVFSSSRPFSLDLPKLTQATSTEVFLHVEYLLV